MSLFRQRDSKIYWMTRTINGVRFRQSTRTTNQRLAEKIHSKWILDIAEGKFFQNESKRRTFEELRDRYIRDHTQVRKAETSVVRDKSLFNHLSGYFGGLTLAEITPAKLSEYQSLRIQEKASLGTIQKELSTLRNALNKAIEWEWLDVSPYRRFKIQPVNDQRERWLTNEEEQKLLAVSTAWLRELIIFSLNVGTRLSETLNLRWPEIDLEKKTATILVTKNKEKRTIPLNDTVITLLKKKIKKRKNSGFVFQTKAGTKLLARNLQRSYNIARVKAGLSEVRWHDLRHTFASRMVQCDTPLYIVQKLLGHKDQRMTQRYSHLTVKALRRGVDILGHNSVIVGQSEKEKEYISS